MRDQTAVSYIGPEPRLLASQKHASVGPEERLSRGPSGAFGMGVGQVDSYTRPLFALGPMLIAVMAAAWWVALCEPAAAQNYTVDPKRIIDGDTFYVSVRVFGADTPEIGNHAKCDKERTWGERAGRRASELLKDKLVTLEIRGVDEFDRLLARVVLPDGRDLAHVLISEDLARPYAAGGPRVDWCK